MKFYLGYSDELFIQVGDILRHDFPWGEEIDADPVGATVSHDDFGAHLKEGGTRCRVDR